MKAKKFSIISFIIILAMAVGIGIICRVIDSNNKDATSTTYETKIYQAYLEVETSNPTTNKDGVKDEGETESTTTTKHITTTKPKETTTKKNNVANQTKPQSSQLIGSLDFGSDDALMLHKIAIAEAGGESVESMALVMLVVLNRTYDSRFPNSIYGVIHQKNQFTPVSNGSYARAQPNEKSKKAMELVVNGWNESRGALYFESCSGSSWHSRNLTYLFEKDGHRYYK